MTNMDLAAQKLEEKRRLYEQHGRGFEQSHAGEYLAIGRSGQAILDKR